MPSVLYEILPKERSIRSLLYYLNKDAQLLMHFVHGQRITPMIQFIPGINWESQYLGQVMSRYLSPGGKQKTESKVKDGGFRAGGCFP